MTKEQYIEEHRKMWTWISEEIGRRKEVVKEKIKGIYLENNGFSGIAANCFLCQCDKERKTKNICASCPVEWTGKSCTDGPSSEYKMFVNAKTWEEQQKIALKIANLKAR